MCVPNGVHKLTHTHQVELNWVHINRSQSFKTVFLGDSNVGKTCLAKLFVNHAVSAQTTNTIGFDHHVKEMKLDERTHIKVSMLMVVAITH